jgi:YopT-type cysteine protease-like protein
MAKVKHIVTPVAAAVNLVQSSAKDFGGVCNQKFSQSTDPVARIIAKLPSTNGGICMMLAAKWIGELANGGSMWDSIYFGGQFNAASIITVMHNFIDDEVQNLNWSYVREQYFKQHNVKHDKKLPAIGNVKAASPEIGKHLATAITKAGQGRWASLDLYGSGGAHSVAAWNAGSQTLFFDPNYGEFSFPDQTKLRSWLGTFGTISGYKRGFGGVKTDSWKR